MIHELRCWHGFLIDPLAKVFGDECIMMPKLVNKVFNLAKHGENC